MAPGNGEACDVQHEDRLTEGSKDGRSMRRSGGQDRLVSVHCRVIPGLGYRLFRAKFINISAKHVVEPPGTDRVERHSSCDDGIAKGRNVPKRANSAGFLFALLSRGEPALGAR